MSHEIRIPMNRPRISSVSGNVRRGVGVFVAVAHRIGLVGLLGGFHLHSCEK